MKRTLLLAGVLLVLLPQIQAATTIIAQGSTWRYWDGGNEPLGWKEPGYVEPVGSQWKQGPGELGYGDGDEATLVSFGPNSSSKYITTYFRKTFTVADPQAFGAINLRLVRDDGAVVYLNGAEVARFNLPVGTITYSTLASSAIEETTDIVNLAASAFQAGNNVLAVEIHQSSGSSSDISFDLELTGTGQIVRGPYLQLGTPSSVVIRWRTASPTESAVRYGQSADSSTWALVQHPTLKTEHEVQLASLTPGARYFYSVGNAQGALASGPDYLFYTSPAPGDTSPARIWVLGDSGTADANARLVRDAYYTLSDTQYTDLLLMLGDNAYDNGADAEYQAAVFDMYPDMLRQTVLWPTIGNHDTAGSSTVGPSLPYFSMFTLPTNSEAGGAASGTEKYYSFDYSNIHFVCLDSMTSSRAANSAMLMWLEADLAQNTLPWVIAFWHHPPYSKGSHNSDTETQLVEMRQNVLPILDAYNVDLVLAGHSHSYERSFLLHGHYGLSSSLTASMKLDSGSGRDDSSGSYNKATGDQNAHEGAVYVVAGSSGKISGGTLNHPAMFTSLNQLGSLVIDVNANKLDVRFLRENGAITDYFSIVKANARPFVTITTPQNGSSFAAPANVTISANSSDSDGQVAQVTFYANGALLGVDNSAPYEFPWSSVPAGSYALTAQARDNLGVTSTSSAVSVQVINPNSAPEAPGNLQGTGISTTQVALSWTDNSGNETGFRVERKSGKSWEVIANLGAGMVSHTDSGLKANTSYSYRVQAFNSTGASPYSNQANVKTLRR